MRIYLILSLVISLTACHQNTPVSVDELKDLKKQEWFIKLNNNCESENACKIIIDQGIYNGDTVYYSYYTGSLCDTFFHISLLNQNGDTIKSYDDRKLIDVFNGEVTMIETIYKCE